MKSVSHILWHSLSQAVTHVINCKEEDCSALTEAIHAGAMKDIEAVLRDFGLKVARYSVSRRFGVSHPRVLERLIEEALEGVKTPTEDTDKL